MSYWTYEKKFKFFDWIDGSRLRRWPKFEPLFLLLTRKLVFVRWSVHKSFSLHAESKLGGGSEIEYQLSWPTSGPELCVVWVRKMPVLGWGSLWELSSFVPWFSTFVFRNVPGTVPECVRICGFKRNSSNLDIAPKMRDSVLLHSWDSFLVTMPSISSKTFVIYSSLILGTDWPFLECSFCVSLVTSANFRLFLNVAMFFKKKCYADMKTELIFFASQLEIITKNVIL